MTINFHIGAPRIGAELLHAVAVAPSLKTHPRLFILPQASYWDNFRTLVNTRKSTDPKDSRWYDAERQIRSLAQYGIVAVSQHAALGTHNELISSQRGLARAAARIAAISLLFNDSSLTLHFIIASQVGYLNWTLGSEARATISAGTTFSWSDIIGSLKAAAPERPFVVWDFAKPKDVALSFVAEMLGTLDNEFLTEAHHLIETNHSYQNYSNMKHDWAGLEDSIARLDEQYETDLNTIAEMEGVALINSSTLRKKLHRP
jgi:hypothetical protein